MAKPYSFSPQAMQVEADYVKRRQLTQIGEVIVVPVSALGIAKSGDSSGWRQVNLANGLALHKNIGLTQGGGVPVMVTSSALARVLVQFNDENSPWISFALIANSLDWMAATGTIYRVRFSVQTVDAGAAMYFTTLTAFGLNSSGVAGGGSAQGGYNPGNSGNSSIAS